MIDVIQSDDVLVQGNSIADKLFQGMQVTGSSARKVKRCIFKNNTVKGSARTKNAMYFDYIEDCQINDNTIYDGSVAIAIQNRADCTINDNSHYGGDSKKITINIISTCHDCDKR
ncbi:right-handed parallel beta-helix repeat-containing protein [Cytobacillus oceanisediminis]|nr:right-handed parallel beta-helix repeat-containing protein [Cytobacillus oceanisediminis]